MISHKPSDIGIAKAYSGPALLSALMLLVAWSLSNVTGVRPVKLFEPYLISWTVVTLLCMLVWLFVTVATAALHRERRVLPAIGAGLSARLPLLFVPAIIFPLFLAGYTWAKSSIPFVVGYPWESFWSEADRLVLLGNDAWRIAHAVMPESAARFWSFFYSMIWGVALVFGGAIIFSFGTRRQMATFFTALMLSWMIGGVGAAYLFSAGGPIFAHITDPSIADRYEPLRGQLLALLGDKDVVMRSQRYLAMAIDKPVAIKGGGISAMPSMHIATATILALTSWRTFLRPVAIAFWLMTFFGSVYFGYHYMWDAPVAAVIAFGAWLAARRYYEGPRLAGSAGRSMPTAETVGAAG